MASWPARGVWVPTRILSAPISPKVRDTWISLRAIASGKDYLEVSFEELKALTGKCRSTVNEHLATLRDRCGLRYHTAGASLVRVYFDASDADGPQDSQSENLDSPVKVLSSQDSVRSESKVKPSAQSENLDSSRNLEKAKKPSAYNMAIKSLCELFSKETGIPIQESGTARQRGTAAALWWTPLGEIYAMCGKDSALAARVIRATIKAMKDSKLTIATPKSIRNTANAEFARLKTARPATVRNADGSLNV